MTRNFERSAGFSDRKTFMDRKRSERNCTLIAGVLVIFVGVAHFGYGGETSTLVAVFLAGLALVGYAVWMHFNIPPEFRRQAPNYQIHRFELIQRYIKRWKVKK